MKKEQPVWLNLGCGVGLAKPPFINVDNYLTLEDLKEGVRTGEGIFRNAKIPKGALFQKGDLRDLPFESNSVDYVEANDVIEHIEMRDVDKALSEMYRVLKPGGKLGLSTTNFDELARIWTKEITYNPLNTQKDIDKMITLSQVIYGHQSSLGEFHKVPFNPFILGYRLQIAGFKLENFKITIYPTNTHEMMPQLAYGDMVKNRAADTVILTEMMWVDAIK